MVELTDLIEVVDNRTEEKLKLEATALSAMTGRKVDWRSCKRDFTGKAWKPGLLIVEGAQHPYHAYVFNPNTKTIDKEGEYAIRTDAEGWAMDYASVLNK
ncbi:MAG: hypothetical protein WCV90_07055 [Candidatus Woesearchaeota archaeon]